MRDGVILAVAAILFVLSTGYGFYSLITLFLTRKRRFRLGAKRFDKNSLMSMIFINNTVRAFPFPGKQKVKKMLERAGSPYGLTFKKYYIWKTMLAVLFTMLWGANDSAVMRLIYCFIGFMVLDVMIYIQTKRREGQIRNELPNMIDSISRSLSAGVPMIETLVLLSKRLKGPLAREVSLLFTQYQLEGNMERALQRFRERVAMKEVDHLCLALRQGEQSGRMKGMLNKQSHMLKRFLHFQETISTRNRANFLPLVTVGMVINILLLTVVPMVLLIVNSGQRFQ